MSGRQPRSWQGWYFVATDNLAVALREARVKAAEDHPTNPPESMMTPTIRRVSTGVRVHVIGRTA